MTTHTPDTATTSAAADFLAWEASLGPYDNWTSKDRDERKARFKALPTADKYRVKRDKVDGYFTPENALPERQRRVTSPSGRYQLVTTPYGTKPGSWSFTLGELFRLHPEGTERVAEVRRNYSSLWHTWVENHAVTGHDYLLTGEDYQGFTVVNLTTGKVSTFIPDEALEGHGWCPVSAELLADGVTLKVEGCYWACPYEYRLWDFSEPDALDFPEKGLLDLTEGLWLDNDEGSELVTNEAGSMVLRTYRKKFRATGEYEHDLHAKVTKFHERAHKAKRAGDEAEAARAKADEAVHDAFYSREDDAEHDALWERELYHERVYSRAALPNGRSGKYEQVGEWKSPLMRQDEARREEYEKKSREEFAHYRDQDPFYAHLKKAFPSDYRERTGKQGLSLVMRWDGDDNPFYFHFRLTADLTANGNKTAALVWGAKSGPLKVEAWTRGTGTKTSEFPRTDEGYYAALEYMQDHLWEPA